MKKQLFLILACMVAGMALHAQADYQQWETSYYRVKPGQEENFKKGLAAHNKKYHAANPYKIHVFDVMTGPNSGSFFLAMGPTTFSQMDGRPAGDEHSADWAKAITPYVESVTETVYWRLDDDKRFEPEGSDGWPLSRWRHTTIHPGEGDRFEENMEKVIAVYKAKNYPAAFRMYWRWGASTGSNVITEMNLPNWAALDRDVQFRADFESVHGAASYQRFLEELAIAVDREKTYDELVQYNSELSSPQ